jgi:GntR family transcriptional repressor for pyruvate dehydrogenase complex
MTKQLLVYEAVLDEIKRRIADGELRPGQRLPSNTKLSEEFHVGVSSVREALRVLAASGVVRIEHGSGVFVSPQPPPPNELRERFLTTEIASLSYLMEARLIIEPEVAALAAERATPGQVKRIQELAERMNRNFRAHRDWLEADLGFHNALCEAAGNPIIEGMLRQASDLLVDSRRQTMRDRQVSKRACRFHLLIASAVAEHKPMLARALMHEHMQDAVEVFSRLYGHADTAQETPQVRKSS